uniref:Uncharacterized protein n=1 Tax=Oryza nivara TaxID=4536 RepID=A0A0E0IV91_ORYNI
MGGRMTWMQSNAQVGLRDLHFLDKTSGRQEGGIEVCRSLLGRDEPQRPPPKESSGKCIGESAASLLSLAFGLTV